MALPTAVISNGFTFAMGAVQHNCDMLGFEEIVSTYGGEEVITACGVLRTPVSSTITGLKVTLVQNLASTGLFRYLRENTCAGTEALVWAGTLSLTEGSTNPEMNATASGWTKPAMKTSASGGYPTVEAEFTFTAVPTVDVT